MKKFIPFLIVFCLLCGLKEPSYGQSLSSQSITLIKNEVDSVFHSAIKAAENLDYDQISKGVSDKYNAGFILNGSYYTTYSSMISVLTSNLQAGAKQKIAIQNEKISVLTPNIVLLTATGNAKVDLNTGQSFTSTFFWSFVYEKINGQWKVVQSHQSINR